MTTQNENDNSVRFLFTEITNDFTPKITSVDYLNHLKGGETYEKIIENHDNDINAHSTLISEIVNKNAQQDIEIAKKADSTSLAPVATNGDYNSLTNKPSLSPVATTGNYNDLSNKPSIPNAQVNSDWNAVNGVAKILNKPFIPTKTSDLTNDSGFVDAGSFNNNPHSLKAYLYEGGLLSDAQGLADVKSYAHSIYNSNGFTAVGSPVITNDGIASGFSTDDYLTSYELNTTKPWQINLRHTIGDASEGETILSSLETCKIGPIGYTNYHILTLQRSSIYGYYFNICATSGNNPRIVADGTAAVTLNNGDVHDLILKFTGSSYILSLSINGSVYEDIITVSSSDTMASATLILGKPISASGVSSNALIGTADLKRFSVKVDNVPVFSGSKTGVDVIKQDYTVNGSPTISADGVASGFSALNYLSKSFQLINSYDSLEIDLGEITSNAFTNYQWFFKATETSNSISKGFMIMITDTGKARWFAGSGASNYDIASGKVGNIVYSTGQKIKFKLVFTGTQYVLYSSVNGGNWQVDSSVDSTLKINFNTTIMLGTDGTANCLSGSYDVNGVKIIKDGEIVWQPCLKIPYIQSKTGSKVVDAVYRNRVTDMYEQYGYAPYYTLSDSDFTIPKGELYGITENKVEEYTQWIYKPLYLAQTSQVTGTAEEFSLSSYLPNDDYNYEVMLAGAIVTGTTNSERVILNIATDIFGDQTGEGPIIPICQCVNCDTTFPNYASGTVIAPVGAGRKIISFATRQQNPPFATLSGNSTYTLQCLGYRKTGKNN